MIGRESLKKGIVSETERYSTSKNNRSSQNLNKDTINIKPKPQLRPSSSVQKTHGVQQSYTERFKAQGKKGIQPGNSTSQSKTDRQEAINSAFFMTSSNFSSMKKRDKKFPQSQKEEQLKQSKNSQSAAIMRASNQYYNNNEQPNKEVILKVQMMISKQNEFLHEMEREQEQMKSSLLSEQKFDNKNRTLQSQQGESCEGSKKSQSQLIYDKTLYRNDESFPTKEQISKKIADLVLQKMTKVAPPHPFEALSPSHFKEESSQQLKNSDVYQEGFSLQSYRDSPRHKLSQKQHFFSDQKQQQSDITSIQQLHLTQESQLQSQHYLQQPNESKQQEQSIQNLPKTYSQCLSPNFQTRETLIKLQSPRQIYSTDNLKQLRIKSECPQNGQEDVNINMGHIFTTEEIDDKTTSAYQIQSSRMRNISTESGSGGSPKFNEMRKRKKQMKNSQDGINLSESCPGQKEYERLKCQIKQIELISDLIEVSSPSQTKSILQTFVSTDKIKPDRIEGNTQTTRNSQLETQFSTSNSYHFKTQASDDRNSKRQITSVIDYPSQRSEMTVANKDQLTQFVQIKNDDSWKQQNKNEWIPSQNLSSIQKRNNNEENIRQNGYNILQKKADYKEKISNALTTGRIDLLKKTNSQSQQKIIKDLQYNKSSNVNSTQKCEQSKQDLVDQYLLSQQTKSFNRNSTTQQLISEFSSKYQTIQNNKPQLQVKIKSDYQLPTSKETGLNFLQKTTDKFNLLKNTNSQRSQAFQKQNTNSPSFQIK